MAHFLMAWEYGGGLGHAARIRPLAEELARRGHDCTLVLRDLVQTDNVLRGTPFRRLQAPVWLHTTVGVPKVQVSLAEILLGSGYLRAEHLQAQVEGWLGLLELTGADAVIADYAPTAILAARVAGLPSASIGIGFYVPPDASPLPPFRNWEPIPAGRVELAERQALASVNAVLAAHRRPPLDRLAPVLRGDVPLLCTWPEVDHYERGPLPAGQRFHGPSFLPSGGGDPVWPPGTGPKVFAYLKAGHPDHAAVLQALDKSGCRTLCYLPEVAAGMPAPVLSPNVHYSKQPVNLGTAFADDCRLAVCHAGEATLLQALLAGIPLLLLPTHAEQFLMARAVARTGAAINAAEHRRPTHFKALVGRLIEQPEAAGRAAEFAQKYAGFTHQTQARELVDAFEAMLPRP